jgi:hypothetical protein
MMTRILTESGVHVINGANVCDTKCIDGKQFLVCSDNRLVQYSEAIWCTQVS